MIYFHKQITVCKHIKHFDENINDRKKERSNGSIPDTAHMGNLISFYFHLNLSLFYVSDMT